MYTEKNQPEMADAQTDCPCNMEMFVIGEMGLERMQQLNCHTALFVELFKNAGGISDAKADA